MKGNMDEAEFKRVLKAYWRYKLDRPTEGYDDEADGSDVVSEEHDYITNWRENMEEPTSIHDQLAYALMKGSEKAEDSTTDEK